MKVSVFTLMHSHGKPKVAKNIRVRVDFMALTVSDAEATVN